MNFICSILQPQCGWLALTTLATCLFIFFLRRSHMQAVEVFAQPLRHAGQTNKKTTSMQGSCIVFRTSYCSIQRSNRYPSRSLQPFPVLQAQDFAALEDQEHFWVGNMRRQWHWFDLKRIDKRGLAKVELLSSCIINMKSSSFCPKMRNFLALIDSLSHSFCSRKWTIWKRRYTILPGREWHRSHVLGSSLHLYLRRHWSTFHPHKRHGGVPSS